MRGFTLVEMLVVLALTLIMMTLFANVFTITGNFVSRQKGIAENDQSARIITTALQNDLQARTMRVMAAFQPTGPAVPVAYGNRQGYLYYSENNPLDDTDDVLQLTIDTTKLPLTNPVKNGQIYGAATNLPLPWQPGTTYQANALVRPTGTSAPPATGYVYKNLGGSFTSGAAGSEPAWPGIGGTVGDNGGTWTTVLSAVDQPDGDDGGIAFDALGNPTVNPANSNSNNTGASQYAEVSYFLRHGNLYRRVLLIRNPYNVIGSTGTSQPVDTTGTALIPLVPTAPPTAPYPPAGYVNNNFWTDFDYAARIQYDGAGNFIGVNFHSQNTPENSLDNTPSGSVPLMQLGPAMPLGRPDNRFGHDQTTTLAANAPNGAPREYDSNGTFFGRFTHEETSNLNFLFPGSLSPGGANPLPAGVSPMSQLPASNVTLDTTGSYITQFQGGSRRGEDILLTNVVSFDVKILDNFYSEAATFDLNRNGVIEAGPAPAFADVGHTGPTGVFRQQAIQNTASGAATPAYGPKTITPYTTTINAIVYNNNNVFDTWHPQFDFDGDNTADVPPYTGLPNLLDGVGATNPDGSPHPYWTAGATYSVGTIVAPDPATGVANGLQYVCISGGAAGGAVPFNNADTIPATTPIVDGAAQWLPQAPVQAIQITVKYLDPTQNLLRQVTFVQSLTP